MSQKLLEFRVNIISNADCESWLQGNVSTKRLEDSQNLGNIYNTCIYVYREYNSLGIRVGVKKVKKKETKYNILSHKYGELKTFA